MGRQILEKVDEVNAEESSDESDIDEDAPLQRQTTVASQGTSAPGRPSCPPHLRALTDLACAATSAGGDALTHMLKAVSEEEEKRTKQAVRAPARV